MTRLPRILLTLSITWLFATNIAAQSAIAIYEAVIVQYDRAASVIRIQTCGGCTPILFKTSADTTIRLADRVVPFDPMIGYSGAADIGVDPEAKALVWVRPSDLAGKLQ